MEQVVVRPEEVARPHVRPVEKGSRAQMFVKRVVGRNGRLRLRVPTVEALAGLACSAGVLALTGSAASAQAQPRAALADELGSGVRVALMRRPAGSASSARSPAGRSAGPRGCRALRRRRQRRARSSRQHGGAFGLGPSASLRLIDERTAPGRRSSLRFQQLLDGVPVLGGELIVNLDDRAADPLGERRGRARVRGRHDAGGARRGRRGARAPSGREAVRRGAGDLEAGRADALDLRLPPARRSRARPADARLARPGDRRRFRLDRRARPDRRPPRRRGAQLQPDRRGEEPQGLRREQHDGPGPVHAPVRVEGGAASPVADVNLAYQYSGNWYDFFKNRFNRDSFNGAGGAMISTVRACEPGFGAARSATGSGTASRSSSARGPGRRRLRRARVHPCAHPAHRGPLLLLPVRRHQRVALGRVRRADRPDQRRRHDTAGRRWQIFEDDPPPRAAPRATCRIRRSSDRPTG